MSEQDEPEAKPVPLRRRRRSLRVPVDDVPRPTQLDAADGASTLLEVPAYDDEQRMTLQDARKPFSDPPRSSDGDPEIESEPVDELDAAELEADPDVEASALDELDLASDLDSDEDDDPAITTESVEPPAPAVVEPEQSGKVEAQAEPSPTDAPQGEADPDTEAEVEVDEPEPVELVASAPESSPAAAVVPIVGVVVQRVVAVASPQSSRPPPQPEPEAEAASEAELETSGPEVSVEVDEDDDEPELRIGEPDANELEELDVDVDEAEQQAAALREASAAAKQEEPRDSAPELTHEEAEELLEIEEAQARAAAKKRPSKPPPPPKAPTKSKEAPKEAAPPPREPEPATSRRKKLRRNWWEELFNDDYLRTVPIPHPRVIARQCDFIEQRFGLARGATILDVGCGLGLHAVELTRRGYLVVGLDLSLPMLARAADEAQDSGFKINFLHADMREMNFDGAFDAVLCYNTTFGYFDDEGNKQVVERLYRALKPRGLLLLEVVNRDYVVRSQPNLVWFEGDGCVVMEESQMNYITSRLEVKRTVILDDGRQRDNLYSLRTYALHELGQILHHQGFRVVEVSGWEAHPGVFFGADSPKIIILAERRPAGPPVPPSRGADGTEAAPPREDTSSGEGRAEAAAEIAEPAAAAEVAPPKSADEVEAEELAEEDLETDA
jgi:SAM-dependent methyltransferase